MHVSRETLRAGSRSEALSAVPSRGSFERDELSEIVPDMTLESIFGSRVDMAVRYHDLLATRGIEWGLLGPREAERLWSRHILNCAAIAPMIPADACVVDVGSGAGLPGIPLALVRPDLNVTLLDSLLRRVQFLELVTGELGLGDQVTVVRERAEQCTRVYEVVVARAVAPLWRLIEWCEPMMGKCLVALKGEGAETEVEDAASILDRRGLAARVVHVNDHIGGIATAVEVVRR